MNHRISDGRLIDILQTGACPTLPRALHRPAFRLTQRLLAAEAWGDVYWPVAQLPDGRYASHVYGRWILAFVWSPAALAHALALERI